MESRRSISVIAWSCSPISAYTTARLAAPSRHEMRPGFLARVRPPDDLPGWHPPSYACRHRVIRVERGAPDRRDRRAPTLRELVSSLQSNAGPIRCRRGRGRSGPGKMFSGHALSEKSSRGRIAQNLFRGGIIALQHGHVPARQSHRSIGIKAGWNVLQNASARGGIGVPKHFEVSKADLGRRRNRA